MLTSTSLRVTVVDSAVARQDIAILRNIHTRTAEFRAALKRLTAMVTIEATRNLPTTGVEIQTPLTTTTGHFLATRIVIAMILRAAERMVDPILEFFPEAEIGCIGTRRDEETAQPSSYLCKLPAMDGSTTVLLADVMLATGGSACDAINRLKAAGAKNIRLLCIIAAPEGIAKVNEEHPDVEIFADQVDEGLNERAYIVPGLGDAGDRGFGT